MKMLFILICLFFTSFSAIADEGGLLDLRKRTSSGIVKEVFSGKPVVSFAPIPQKQEKFVPTPYQKNELIPFLSATNIFGKEDSFPYLTHFPYFFVDVDILSDGRISVTERFQLVISQNNEKQIFFRHFLKTYPNTQGEIIRPIYDFISLKHNGKKTSFKMDDKEKEALIYLPNTYVGLHMYEMTYHVQNIFKGNELLLSLSGKNLPVPVEQFSGRLRFPSNASPSEAHLVFGTNNLGLQQGIDYLKERETLAFKIERVVPEGTDVKVHILFDENAFAPISLRVSFVDFFMNHLSFFIALIGALFWICYAFIQNKLSKRIMKGKEFVLKAQKRILYTPTLARFLIKKKVDEKTVLSLIFSLKQKKVLHFDDEMQELIYERKNVKLSGIEKKLLRLLFSKKKQTKLNEKMFEKYIGKTLKKEVWFKLIFLFVSLTRQMWLMGVFLFLLTLGSIAFVGITPASISTLIIGFLIGAFLFVWHSGFLLYIKQSYQSFYLNLCHFSQHTSSILVLNALPFAIALDLTNVFSPIAPKETAQQFSLTEQENLLLNKIKMKRNKK